MTRHRMGIDEKWEVFLNEFIPPNGWEHLFAGADITFKLTFTSWPISVFYGGALAHREFRWVAIKTDDKWRWVPKTLDKDYVAPRNFADRFKVKK
jgi:hypothetical protein